MRIDQVHQGIVKHKRRKRVGRGIGSGHGKTCGRGGKGQTARAGWSAPAVFEGGQMPLVRRIPKRGFHNRFALAVATVNVGELESLFQSGEEVGVEALRSKGALRGRFDLLKVLGDGELTKSLKVAAHRFSRQAREKIERAGGEAVVLPGKAPVVKGQERPQRKKKT